MGKRVAAFERADDALGSGQRDERVTQRGHDQLSVFGIVDSEEARQAASDIASQALVGQYIVGAVLAASARAARITGA